MSALSNLGIPDLPMNAFRRMPNGRLATLEGGGKGSAPDTPDYEAAARATAEGNLDLAKYTTQANRINQYTPFGSLTYTNNRSFDQAGYDAAMAEYERELAARQEMASRTPSKQYWNASAGGEGGQYTNALDNGLTPTWHSGAMSRMFGIDDLQRPDRADFYGDDNWEQRVELAPELQAILDQQWRLQHGLFGAQDAALGRVQDVIGRDFDVSQLPAGGTPLDLDSIPQAGDVYDPTQNTNQATELLMARMNPELDRQYEMLRSQLANQGIAQGSEAYRREMERFGQQRNDAANQAALHGIGLGMQQQGQTFGQQTTNRQLAAALQAQQFGQQEGLRQGRFSEQAWLRNLPMQELAALSGGQQVQMPQFPGYAMQAQTGGPDLMGAANAQYGADLGAWNAQQAQRQGLMSGLGGIGQAAGAYFGGPVGGLIGGAAGGLLGGLFG